MSLIAVPVSFGELIDKITILEIKLARITDRAKDLIKSGGEWISSVEVETLLVDHPAAQVDRAERGRQEVHQPSGVVPDDPRRHRVVALGNRLGGHATKVNPRYGAVL